MSKKSTNSKMKNKREITLHDRAAVLVVRGDGLQSIRHYYGLYDLILELGGNLGDVLHYMKELNAGRVVRFGTLRVSLI